MRGDLLPVAGRAQPAGSLRWPTVVTWAIPLVVAAMVWRGDRERVLLLVIGGVMVAALAAATLARPALAATILLGVLPLQLVILAKAYDLGLPAALADQASTAKELVVLGLAAVAVSHQREMPPPDRLDRVALTFVGLVTAYLLLAAVFGPLVGDLFPRAPDDVGSLLRSFRTNVAFVVLFLALRRVPMTARERTRLTFVAVAVGVVVGLGGIVEYLDPSLWQRLVTDWAQVPRFSREVLGGGGIGGTVTQPLFGGARDETVRVSSFLFSPLVVGFYLVVPMGVLLALLARRPTVTRVGALGVITGTIVLTSTRSAALAAGVAMLAALVTLPVRWLRDRARLVMVAVSGLFVATIVASTTGLATRFLGALTGDDPSATGHREATLEAVELVARNPFGLGLGAGPTVSGRATSERVVSENSYLQVGTELGVLGMLLFVVLLVLVALALVRRARQADASALARGTAAAAIGLGLGGMFLHVWTDVTTAWTFWGLSAVALAHPSREST